MTLADGAGALLAAVLTAGWTPPALRRLAEPRDDPDAAAKIPYAALATPAFAAGIFAACLTATLLAVALVPVAHWTAWAALTTVSVLACGIDFRTTYLPRILAVAGWVLAAVGVGVAAVADRSLAPALAAACGALGFGGLLWLFWRFTGGFGFGDVRLAATIGAVTALESVALVVDSVILGTVLGAVWSLARRWRTGADTPFPYGPALLAGPFLALGLRALTA